jgi:hypothetical protein
LDWRCARSRQADANDLKAAYGFVVHPLNGALELIEMRVRSTTGAEDASPKNGEVKEKVRLEDWGDAGSSERGHENRRVKAFIWRNSNKMTEKESTAVGRKVPRLCRRRKANEF